KKYIYYIIVLLCLVTALVSGRSALLLSVLIGGLFYILNVEMKKVIKYFLLAIIILLISSYILEMFNVSLINIFNELFIKVFEGGDRARPEQTNALIAGINDNIFGAGHGVGVDYIRSEKFPWRYENVPFSLV